MALALAMPTIPALANERLLDETLSAEQSQAALQARIDAADENTRADIKALRQKQAELRQLTAYNRDMAPRLDQQAATLDDREAALDALGDTREALPGMLHDLVKRLRQWVEADLPFLKQERMARVDSLESLLANAEVSYGEALERVLAAWRTELDYGRELDAWRGLLDAASPSGRPTMSSSGSMPSGESTSAGEPLSQEVDYLRVGRVGLYYLTPDGREGGVWKTTAMDWEPLDSNERAEVDKGLRIAHDQRAPELLTLPVSQPISANALASGEQTDEDSRSGEEGET
ncbi:DUF3450 domain-containing protein [Halomonas salinarum]|uniref:DUF3450 domain-containing protein n=1 Tax=Halomonas salinarum TaxID=1158993 RepID=UPI001FD8050C|nr:DUF3450 domain-containing protein [Halomonas salinarum]